MATLYTKDQLPKSSEEAIRKFDERYLAVLSATPPSGWADEFVQGVDSPRTTFPMSFLATKFHDTTEESGRFAGMEEATFDVNVSEFDAGYEAKVFDLLTNVFAWKRWNDVPSEFRVAEQRHYASKLATLFEAGETTVSPYDGVNFFSAASHKANPKKSSAGTWGNLTSAATPISAATATATALTNIQAQMTAMRKAVKDQNGDKMLVEPTELWLPTDLYQVNSDRLNQALINGGDSNPIKGQLKVVHVPELTNADDWYLVDRSLLSRFVPMIAAKYTELDGQLGLRYLDQNSDHFKNTGKIRVSQHIWAGFGLLFPHAVRKVKGA